MARGISSKERLPNDNLFKEILARSIGAKKLQNSKREDPMQIVQ